MTAKHIMIKLLKVAEKDKVVKAFRKQKDIINRTKNTNYGRLLIKLCKITNNSGTAPLKS